MRRGLVTLTFLPDPSGEPPRLALAVGRRVGGAVVRNRVRRRLREAARELARSGRLPAGAYLASVGPGAATAGFDRLRNDLEAAVGALHPAPAP